MFSKGTQPFDFIKLNVIRKLAYKVKYIDQINGGLIMFFANLRVRFFEKLVGSLVSKMERINTRKRNINKVQCSKCVKITYILFICHRSIDNSNGFCFLLFYREKFHDSKEFSREISKLRRESRITRPENCYDNVTLIADFISRIMFLLKFFCKQIT